MKVKTKIEKALTIIVMDFPFFGSLALRLKFTEDPTIETAVTDGVKLRYNPDYLESLSQKEIEGCIAHEVMHIALGHVWRQEKRDCALWNMACDYSINENLVKSGFTLPEGHLLDGKYDSKPSEEIYNLLLEEQDKKKKENGDEDGKEQTQPETQDPGKCGGVTPNEMPTKEKQELKNTWQSAVSQAAQLAKAGNLPAELQKQIDDILNPEVPWHILLRDFVERTARNDYDWTVPNRRYLSSDFVLPSLISEELPEVCIAIDTSGSIDKKALSQFAAEASNVLGAYNTTIRVLYCDTKVHKEEVYTRADLPMKLKPIGGGGTNFVPVFDYIEEKEMTPCCLIYFTDLYGRFPEQEAEFPTMWLTKTEDEKAPFGVTVHFNG